MVMSELKTTLLELLEKDREFRYAIMGLIGFKELLERFAQLEERQQRLEEHFARLEERQQKLEEHFAKLEDRQQKLEERFAKLEERVIKLEERFTQLEERVTKLEERFAQLEEMVIKLEERLAKLEERFVQLEERFAKLDERFMKLEERQQRLEEEFLNLRRLVEYNRRDIAALAEVTYSRFVWDDLKEEFVVRGEKVLRRRRNARIDNVDIDMLVETDKAVYVVEIKVKPNHHDVDELVSKAEVVRLKLIKHTVPILAGVWVGDEIREYAESRNVKVMEY